MKHTSLCMMGISAFLLASPLNAAMADDMAKYVEIVRLTGIKVD